MIAKAFKSIFTAPRTPKWDAPKHFKSPSQYERDTAYKIHLGHWSRYR